MEGDALIQNVGGSRLHSEDDLNDTNPTNQIVPNTIKNIPLKSPRSSLTEASILSATELGCPQTFESRPKAAQKVEDNGLIRNMGGEDDLKDTDPVDEIVPDTLRNIPLESPRSSLTLSTSLLDSELGYPQNPDSRPLISMNEDQNDAGYDSDGAIGPFFDAVRDEPPLHGPDEEEIGVGLTYKLLYIPEPGSSSSQARRCSRRSDIQETTTTGRIEPRNRKPGPNGISLTRGRTPKRA